MKEVVIYQDKAPGLTRWLVALFNRAAMLVPLFVDLGWSAIPAAVQLERAAVFYLWLLAVLHVVMWVAVEAMGENDRPKPSSPDDKVTRWLFNASSLVGVLCLAAAGHFALAVAMLIAMLAGALSKATLVRTWTREVED